MRPRLLIYSTLIYLFSYIGASASDTIYSAKDILLNLEVGSFHNSLSEGAPGEYKNHKTFKETEFSLGKRYNRNHFSLTTEDKSWMISLKIIGIYNNEYTVCFEDFSIIRPPTYVSIRPLIIKRKTSGNFIVVKEIKKSIPGCEIYYH
ncbi:pesticin immunity protein [Escherichia coli]|uniref:pesticin immunity protein n=1 Tax=Escherichia coli TaxID=562 RepID=UPI000B7F5E8C|nr:pesticin immunity protein [Escherichia coli]ECZ4685617.1 pesticin immunity protein [Salmonella enterica]EII8726981.1 pesticin immunity protein [Escherichia coli]